MLASLPKDTWGNYALSYQKKQHLLEIDEDEPDAESINVNWAERRRTDRRDAMVCCLITEADDRLSELST